MRRRRSRVYSRSRREQRSGKLHAGLGTQILRVAEDQRSEDTGKFLAFRPCYGPDYSARKSPILISSFKLDVVLDITKAWNYDMETVNHSSSRRLRLWNGSNHVASNPNRSGEAVHEC